MWHVEGVPYAGHVQKKFNKIPLEMFHLQIVSNIGKKELQTKWKTIRSANVRKTGEMCSNLQKLLGCYAAKWKKGRNPCKDDWIFALLV